MDYLFNKDIWKKIISNNDEIYQNVFSVIEILKAFGGIIAGGFPRFLLANHNSDDLNQLINNYFYSGGDIDVFFESESQYQAAVKIFQFSINSICDNVIQQESPLKSAINFKIRFSKGVEVKFQLINFVYGNHKEILNSFDITNSKVAIVEDNFFYHKDWYELQDKQMLNLETMNSFYNLVRIKKYQTKYGYHNISDNTCNIITQNFIQLYEKLKIPIKVTIGSIKSAMICSQHKLLIDLQQIYRYSSNEQKKEFDKHFINCEFKKYICDDSDEYQKWRESLSEVNFQMGTISFKEKSNTFNTFEEEEIFSF